MTTSKEKLRPWLMIGVPVLVALAGVSYFLAQEQYVSTDNAYARVAKVAINAQVSGQVISIAVQDNQRVNKGDLLYQINPEPLQITVNRAQAQLNVARLGIEGLKTQYREQQAELQSAQTLADFQQKELARNKSLVATQLVSRSSYDRTETDFKIARQHIAALEQQRANTLVELNGDANIAVDNHPVVRAALSQLDEALLYLSYSNVYAPDSGIVTKVEELQVGSYVNSGTATLALLSDKQPWVEANFRETQLTHIRRGQQATISIDSDPTHRFTAHVVSISPGAGSDFALLPPENATGNWVKVVQRVPVRLEFDGARPDIALFSGTSAQVKIDTQYRSPWWLPFKTLLTTGSL